MAFGFKAWRRAFGNFSLFHHRHCDGHLLSMHQSGTHWLKHMLACAMARHFNIAPPQFNHANDIIGGPRDPVVHEQIPRILSSHSIAHPWLRSSTLARALALPPYVVLVRDLRASLISNYVKWQHRYQMPFSDFLSGDPDGRRFNSDIWWTIRFLNAWGRVYQSRPEHVTVVRYEALRADPEAELARVVAAFGLPLSAEDINHGINMSGKQEMAAKDDPDKPAGAVRRDTPSEDPKLQPDDHAFIAATTKAHLKFNFGYSYDTPAPATSD